MAERTFSADIDVYVKSLGPQSSAALAKKAHEVEDQILIDQTSRRGIKPGVSEATDGVLNKPFEQVEPNGVIYIGFDYRAEIVACCFEELAARSPYVSGTYKNNHTCLLDGDSIGPLKVPTSAQLASVTRVVVTNPVPYARKLEIGVTEGGAPFAKQVDPRIYESACKVIQEAWGAVANIEFEMISLEGGYALKRDASVGHHQASKKNRVGSNITYPAIVIS